MSFYPFLTYLACLSQNVGQPAIAAITSQTAGYEPRISLEALAGLVDGATSRSYARLRLLCELLQQTEDLEAVPLAVRVLQLCWDSWAYHLCLDALMMIQSFTAATRGQAARQEIVNILYGLDTKNMMLSSQLVETLYSYDLIEPPDDEDSVLARIAAILGKPEDEESRSWQGLGIVARCLVHPDWLRPRVVRTRVAPRAWRRHAAAMLR